MTNAAAAQREAVVIGWVDGAPVPRSVLDARVLAMRSGPRACALPKPGTSEDRQLLRWVAQVLFTEAVCVREARRRSLAAVDPVPLPPLVAVQVGSIAAAAWQACPAVGAVFDAVVPPSGSVPDAARSRRWWRVSLAGDDEPLRSIGWTTLDDLPPPLADAVRSAEVGQVVGPVEHHRARVDGIEDRPVDDPRTHSPLGGRAREFARWLDRARAESVRCAVGFEHPGDPSQPDYSHRH